MPALNISGNLFRFNLLRGSRLLDFVSDPHALATESDTK